jgi:hypothetical protein
VCENVGKNEDFSWLAPVAIHGHWEFSINGRAGCDAKKNSLDADHLSVNRLAESRIKALTKAANGEELRQLFAGEMPKQRLYDAFMAAGFGRQEKVTAFAYPFAG